MDQRLARRSKWFLALALTVGGACPFVPLPTHAPSAWGAEQSQIANSGESAMASIDRLKSLAFQALRGGDFDKTSQLLKSATTLAKDPNLVQMTEWLGEFQNQRQDFKTERNKQHEKAVAEVKLLLDNKKFGFAIDKAKDAYLLAEDKDAFRAEPWVDQLVKQTTELAAKCETDNEWFKASRLYSDLGAIEPYNTLWKNKLKVAMRRIRLLATYTPDEFKQLQEVEVKERDAVDALLSPTTKPTTGPTVVAKPEVEENDSFRIDWKDQLRGIRRPMLEEALSDALQSYWKDVKFNKVINGGLSAVKVLVTTPRLDKAFPSMTDDAKRTAFLAALDRQVEVVDKTDQPDAHAVLTAIWNSNRDTLQLPEEVLVNEFSDGAFAELDPFSTPIWPSEWEEFNKSTQGEFSGVGIQIQTDEDGSLKVVSPLEDSPAYRMGIKAGDVITRINGKNAKGITINQAVKTITGSSGTFVTLTIRSPDTTSKDYTIKRETIKVGSLKGWIHLPGGGWDYMVDPDQKIAYMRLTNFTKTSSDELDKAVIDIKEKGAKAIILDLRYNPGGLLSAATEVSDKFLNEGVIVSTRPDREMGPVPPPIEARPSDDDVDVPLVILVNQYSASASEIVSGALKDQHRATIVGERTFGKGSVQMLFPLSTRTAYLKLTTSHYYLPSGRCIHKEDNSKEWGVDPDMKVEMTSEQMRDAIAARQQLDVLQSAGVALPATNPASTATRLLERDPQLSAALLLLRLQLANGMNGASAMAQ